jgi:hypothetical protein
MAAAVAPGDSKPAVLERLGPPDVVALEPGGSVFEYLHGRTTGAGVDVSFLRASFQYDELARKLDRLRVSFDARGIVRSVAVVRETAKAP